MKFFNRIKSKRKLAFSEMAMASFELPFSEREQLLEINRLKVKGVSLDSKFLSLAEQMKQGDLITALFIGDPGTGKTTIARRIAVELNSPVYSQNYALNCEEMHIIGGFIPDEVNGGFKWADGQFTRAFRAGGIYIAEEPNYAKPGVLGIMNNALDGIGELVLPNGEVLQRHADFRFFGCMNVGVVGTQRMNPAFINRMNKVIQFDGLPKEKQIEIIAKESNYENKEMISRLIDAGERIKEKIRNEQIDGATISIRNLINWAKDIRYTKNIVESSYSTVIWAVCLDEKEVQDEILDDIIKPQFEGLIAQSSVCCFSFIPLNDRRNNHVKYSIRIIHACING